MARRKPFDLVESVLKTIQQLFSVSSNARSKTLYKTATTRSVCLMA
jgi:hypothetical protein